MYGTKEISNMEKVLDSRDIIARIEELESDIETALEEMKEAAELVFAETGIVVAVEETDEMKAIRGELAPLKKLADECDGYSDWEYGAQLIHEDYFTDAMIEQTQDIGDLPANIPSYLVIDWDATAENLKADYSQVDFDGETYFIRD